VPAQIGQFPRITSLRAGPDRRLWAVCVGAFCIIAPKFALRPAHPAIQYRRGTTCTGELDGAKDIDGG
jgi:hypothetical protein